MRVLIIDDDATICYTLKEICHFAGWEAKEVLNGRDGINDFRMNGADIILLDYHMPEMDGYTTLQAIRQLDGYVPILLLTGDERQETADRFLMAGATDFAIKPVKAPDLISRIGLHKRLFDATCTRSAFAEKGISRTTVALIVEKMHALASPMTIEELSTATGLAYPTVHRYVQHLILVGKVETGMSYQNVGRPKNRYQLRIKNEC